MESTLHLRFILFITLCVLPMFGVIHADAPENIPLCTAPDGQFLPWAVSDGEGGTIVVWEDYRTGTDWDVYAQRIDAASNLMWEANGVAVCRQPNNQRRLRMVRSGDRAIVVWNDRRTRTNWDIYAQAIDRSGKMLWGEGGVPVCTNPGEQSTQAILSDGEGGALVVWEDERISSEYQDLYIQRMDANGNPVWEIDGIPVFPSDSLQSNPILISDDAGRRLTERSGFYVVWWDIVGDDQWHIMAHRLDMKNGKPLWKAPIVVSPLEGMQGEPRLVDDGQGGIIVVWQLYDNFVNDELYAQRIDRTGKKLWGESGVPICNAPEIQKNASIVSDGHGGIVAVWRDERDVYSDIYAQRIGGDGKPLWEINGIPLCVAGGHQEAPFVARSGKDEFFVAWLDYREDYGEKSSDAIYGQKMNLDGKILWEKDGIPICTADEDQQPPFVVPSESGEVTIVWSDARSDLGDIYLHRIR